MGIPSVGILLHEVIKLMYHAKVKDPIFFRIGTCGGIGLEGGTVVISEEAVDGMLKSYLELVRNFPEKNSYSCSNIFSGKNFKKITIFDIVYFNNGDILYILQYRL